MGLLLRLLQMKDERMLLLVVALVWRDCSVQGWMMLTNWREEELGVKLRFHAEKEAAVDFPEGGVNPQPQLLKLLGLRKQRLRRW